MNDAALVREACQLSYTLFRHYMDAPPGEHDDRIFNAYDRAVSRWVRRAMVRREHLKRVLGVTQSESEHAQRRRKELWTYLVHRRA